MVMIMILNVKRFFFLSVFILATLPVQGCVYGLPYVAKGLFPKTADNLTDRNYAVVELLVQQSPYQISKKETIITAPLELDDLELQPIATPFGRLVTEQMASRLVQLGYRVHDRSLTSGRAYQLEDQSLQRVYSPSRIPIDLAQSTRTADVSNAKRTDGVTLMPQKTLNLPKTGILLTGFYTPSGTDLLVHVRLVNLQDHNIITGFDYRVPYTADLRAIAEPKKSVMDYLGHNKTWF